MSPRELNTRNGGHAAQMRLREIVANPNGNREQRRAAKKLGVVRAPDQCHNHHCDAIDPRLAYGEGAS